METAEEILRNCAKAIGMDLTDWEYANGEFFHYTKHGTNYWNPLEDDCMCIDIITKLQLTIYTWADKVVVFPYRYHKEIYVSKNFSEYSDGRHGAFRAAVVECAAMIAKNRKTMFDGETYYENIPTSESHG